MQNNFFLKHYELGFKLVTNFTCYMRANAFLKNILCLVAVESVPVLHT